MNLSRPKQQFVEDIGMFFESQRMPRMAGRMIGLLLISEPPALTTADFCDSLAMSKASVSTNTRFLIQMGLIEKIGQIGERRDLFRIHPRAHELLLLARQAEFTHLHALISQGISLLENDPHADPKRLVDLEKMCQVAIEGIPQLIERMRGSDIHAEKPLT